MMRKWEFRINMACVFGPVLLGMFVVCVFSTPLNAALALCFYATGLGLLIYAKRDVFEQGIHVSFGPSRMRAKYRRCYWIGYGILAIGVLLSIVPVMLWLRHM